MTASLFFFIVAMLFFMRNLVVRFLFVVKFFLPMFFVIATIDASAQSGLCCSVETAGVVSSGGLSPFWLTADRNGLSSVDEKWGYVRAGVAGVSELKSDWAFEYGADVVGAKNLPSTVFVHQAYVDVSWRWLRLGIGKKERSGELKNDSLSTGALVESENAAPIPQVRLEVSEYRDFFGTNGWFSLRGHIAYGWFGDGNWQQEWVATGTRYAKNVLYHSKSIFWKVGREQSFPLVYEGGVQLVSQFGGKIYNYMDNAGSDFNMPVRVKDFWDIFVFSAGDNEYDVHDRLNVAGNHLGSYHLSLKWGSGNWSLRGYYEHMFEDHSGMCWEYGLWKDCPVGAELQLTDFKWPDNVVVEYFNSRDQTGPVYHDATDEIPDQISARDNYFGHHAYPCWQHYGMIIGTPLITSCLYNDNNRFRIYNNRVEAFHFGASGHPIREFSYRLLLTFSHNWGTYKIPFVQIKSNLSGLLELSYMPRRTKGLCTFLSFAFDDGELYGNNRGGMLGIRKVFEFKHLLDFVTK